MNTRTCSIAVTAVLALAACDRAPVAAAPALPPAAPAAPADPQDPTGGLAPPLVIPGENLDAPQPPSYEVSIASAAAEHNKALERCMKQPDAVRTQCQQEANSAFAEAQQSLETLRGNPE
jgi:hypothetical protein